MAFFRGRLVATGANGTVVYSDDDANFAVNPEDGLAYCHSQCGRGWSILQLEREISGPQQFEDIKREKIYLESLVAGLG